MEKARLRVTGVVQGVGFRPFCARTAARLDLAGTVRNTSGGVELVLEGESAAIDLFINALWEQAPEAAVVSGVWVERKPLDEFSFQNFSIEQSMKSDQQKVLIPPDLAVCPQCLEEMRNPKNRRYRYPFINCTLCGPRYSIIRSLPYDRQSTTMHSFVMCPECKREYTTPSDRRYHAQPNACPVCGPQIWLVDGKGSFVAEREAALVCLQQEIAKGAIAAIKGIGGFHVACLPEDGPVRTLRRRKRRPEKPFALMVKDISTARKHVIISEETEKLLLGVQRPILLCPRLSAVSISEYIAPAQKRLGIMLPYAPLHHLLMEKFEALVMTSANISDAPIVSSEKEAFHELEGIADFFLCHNRDIHTPIDDSVLLVDDNAPKQRKTVFIRRARGYVPVPLALPFEPADILAAGAQMKSTYTLVRGNVLFPGQYLGDLAQLGTAEYYKKSLAHFMELYEVKPCVLAIDEHPGYVSSQLARSFCGPDVRILPVQHHHAHLASLLLDNGLNQKIIGVVFDGTGYGDSGEIWGGEFLVGDIRSYWRGGSLVPFKLLGGEKAIQEPWRCGLSLLQELCGAHDAERYAGNLWKEEQQLLKGLLTLAPRTPSTTSCGRLFDGVASILGLCKRASYDGQAASLLENCARPSFLSKELCFEVVEENGFHLLDWRGALQELIEALGKGEKREALADSFHRGLAKGIVQLCCQLRSQTGIGTVGLTGGVWQNALLLFWTCKELECFGFNVLTHRSISPNDEGISVGQAAVAAYNWKEAMHCAEGNNP